MTERDSKPQIKNPSMDSWRFVPSRGGVFDGNVGTRIALWTLSMILLSFEAGMFCLLPSGGVSGCLWRRFGSPLVAVVG